MSKCRLDNLTYMVHELCDIILFLIFLLYVIHPFTLLIQHYIHTCIVEILSFK